MRSRSEPALLLRWRGCLAGEDGGAVGATRGSAASYRRRARCARSRSGAMLKRLGPSGIAVGDEDLAQVLERAYEAFARLSANAAASSGDSARPDAHAASHVGGSSERAPARAA